MNWNISTRSENFLRSALARQGILTKPTGALGILEDVAVWLADIQQTEVPTATPAATIVFASDHPVSLLGVSAYPREVTPMMVRNLACGGAAASVLSRLHNTPLYVVDVGVEPYEDPIVGVGMNWSKVPSLGATGNLIDSDAMDSTSLQHALKAGAAAVDQLPSDTRLVIFGEMGIGNTTPAAAISARLLNQTAQQMVGPGTGVVGEALTAKRDIVQQSLDRTADTTIPMDVLQRLGGREIAAIVGGMGRAAEKGLAILVDGFIVSSAALVAVRHDPRIRSFMWFGHRSAEPGHASILDALNAKPLIDAGLRLGEGSGALTALPLIQAAVELHNKMATFSEAAVPNKEE